MQLPAWLLRVVNVDVAELIVEPPFVYDPALHTDTAKQTADTFSFKWSQHSTFEREEFRANSGNWYREKYGPLIEDVWWDARRSRPLVVEIGPGAGVSAEYLLQGRLSDIDYLGIDISTSIVEARACLEALGGSPWFLQADVLKAPLHEGCADLVFSEGVLHHTDSTEMAVRRAASLVAPGGRLAFYVYKKKALVREFTDDALRAMIADLPPQEAWNRLMPLSRLGRTLGELGVEITIEEPVDLLGIPAGTYDLQRFFYWFFFKAYYRPNFSMDEMNHINFDWYTPKNCHRHDPDEVQGWIDTLGFTTDWFHVEEAGITVVASRPAS